MILNKFKKLPFALQMLVCFLAIVCIGLLCLTVVYAIPTEKMQYHAKLSADTIYKDGDPAAIVKNGDQSYRLDAATDSHMLIIAAYSTDRPPLFGALLNEYEYFNDPRSTVIYKAWSDDVEFETNQYSRYWHGYLVFLKPLLLFFSYHDIRDIMMIVQFSLAAAIVGVLGMKKQSRYIPAFLAVWLFMNPLSLCMAMQYNSVFTLTLVVFLVCILMHDSVLNDSKTMYLFFLAVGCLTSYFDFLTFPLVTFGIPIIYVLQRRGSGYSSAQQIVFLCKTALTWILGYALMWGSKWVLADLITGSDVIENAVSQVLLRTGLSEGESEAGYFDVLANNFSVNRMHAALALFAALTGIAVGIIRKSLDFKQVIPVAITALSPFVWYFVTQNHSYFHYWFTYRELGITVFSLWAIAAIGFFGKRKTREKLSCHE